MSSSNMVVVDKESLERLQSLARTVDERNAKKQSLGYLTLELSNFCDALAESAVPVDAYNQQQDLDKLKDSISSMFKGL